MILLNVIFPMLLATALATPGFREQQMKHSRVKTAYRDKQATIATYFGKLGFSGRYEVFFRAFKAEQVFEVWVRMEGHDQYSLLHTYPICRMSGVPGPKRREGDLQVPEGVYHIDRFNPQSNFHLGLGINYPNNSDKILSDKQAPGTDIFIHGACVTTGCLPLTDDLIQEVYILAVEAREHGQEKIPVHIFPARLDAAVPEKLAQQHGSKHLAFWKNLQAIYLHFKTTASLPDVRVTADGSYKINP